MSAPVSARNLVHRLTQVFRREGYDGASLTVLARETGLGRASLYHHFPGGKEEMARAVFARVSQDFTRAVLSPLAGTDAPAKRFAGMANGLDTFYDGGRNACLIDVFTLGGAKPLFADAVGLAVDYWAEAIVRVLAEAGVKSDLAHERAEQAIVSVEGALIVARATGRLEPFARALHDLPAMLLEGASFTKTQTQPMPRARLQT